MILVILVACNFLIWLGIKSFRFLMKLNFSQKKIRFLTFSFLDYYLK